MDVFRPLIFLIFSIHSDFAPSNIWAPEQQKDVVLVCINLLASRYLTDSISRHWQNITIFLLGFVALCAPIILRVSQ